MRKLFTTVCLVLVLLFAVSAIAADRVVVVPLGGTTEIQASINWKGEWSAGESYQNGDGVQWEGSSYLCVGNPACTLIPPAGSWDLMAAKGDKGDDGGITAENDPQVRDDIALDSVPRWDGSALATGTIYDIGTGIGIGTPIPVSALEVKGEIRTTDDAGDNRLWGQGRIGVYVSQWVEKSDGSEQGLGSVPTQWAGAAAGCPSGSWVCTEDDVDFTTGIGSSAVEGYYECNGDGPWWTNIQYGWLNDNSINFPIEAMIVYAVRTPTGPTQLIWMPTCNMVPAMCCRE